MRLIIILFVAFGHTASAQGLSPQECDEIFAIYGVRACGVGQATPVVLTEPTPKMRADNIFFRSGGVALDAQADLQIQRLAAVLNSASMRNVCLKLVGYSDSSGATATNLEIGQRRAAAVRNRMALLLSDPHRIELLESQGEGRPIQGLPAASPWQRRVEIWARTCSGA